MFFFLKSVASFFGGVDSQPENSVNRDARVNDRAGSEEGDFLKNRAEGTLNTPECKDENGNANGKAADDVRSITRFPRTEAVQKTGFLLAIPTRKKNHRQLSSNLGDNVRRKADTWRIRMITKMLVLIFILWGIRCLFGLVMRDRGETSFRGDKEGECRREFGSPRLCDGGAQQVGQTTRYGNRRP